MEIIKNHKAAFILAVLTGIIVASPQIYFPYENRETYKGIFYTCTDNESFYFSRVREVKDGYPGLGSAIFQDGKEDPYLQSPFGEILTGFLGKILFLGINNTILLARFLFPFLVFLLLYGFVFSFTKRRLFALSASSALLLGNSLFTRHVIPTLLRGEALGTTFLDFFRPVQPQTNLLFFFAFLFFFWLFFEKKQWRWGGVSALIFGLSFYVYPYTWTFLSAFLGVLIIILFFKRRLRDAKKIALMALTGIIIAIPYFLNLYRALLHPYFTDATRRFGIIEGRPLIIGFLLPALFIIFLLFFPKKWKEQFVFSLALLLSPFLVLNQQLITGKTMATGHYHWFISRPIALVFLIIILFYQAGRINAKIPKILAVFIIGMSIYAGINIQAASYEECKDQILSEQRYAPIIQWLDKNANKGEVVLADSDPSNFISIYTPLNLFYASPAHYYLSAPDERVLESIFLFYRLEGLAGREAKEFFLQDKEREYISRSVYNEYYKEKLGDTAAIPDEVIISFAEKYKKFLLVPLEKILKRYKVNYVVWDKKKHPFWQLDQYQFLKPAYEIEDFKIYIIK
ncbi:MAG: hypothetical protein HYW70_02960 [Candidatus Nealsonbacteria bacterium]|nr:hypothetical protein [Candidatus Nealsonbacteria bacterium]